MREQPLYWKLNPDHTVTPYTGTDEEQVLAWGKDFNDDARFLAQDEIEGMMVSTIFLGIDHAFGHGPPILFETMWFSAGTRTFTFAGKEHEAHEALDQRRYATWDEAMAGHAELVAEARKFAATTQISHNLTKLKANDE